MHDTYIKKVQCCYVWGTRRSGKWAFFAKPSSRKFLTQICP